jgi:hypothetical protein
LIKEVRGRLSKFPKGAGSIDPVTVAHELAARYSIAIEEIRAIVIKEADAARVSHF